MTKVYSFWDDSECLYFGTKEEATNAARNTANFNGEAVQVTVDEVRNAPGEGKAYLYARLLNGTAWATGKRSYFMVRPSRGQVKRIPA